MPVFPVVNFEPETFEQANPWFSAVRNLQGLQREQTTQASLPEKIRQEQLLRAAQIKREQQLAQSPFGGHFAPGIAGQVQGLEYIRNKYGENSPQYASAKEGFRADIEAKKSRSAYYGTNVGLKYLPAVAKLKKLADQAYESGDFNLANRLRAASQKYTSDTQTRTQAQGANQLVQEAEGVNIEPITHFSGLGGRLKEGLNALESGASTIFPSLASMVPKDYTEYRNFKQVQMPLMVDTIRKALQTSVMPTYLAANIQPLSDPTSYIWNNPEIVRSLWKQYKDWLHSYANRMNKAVMYGVDVNSPASASQVPRRTSPLRTTFSSKQEFEDYYHSLSPEERKAFRQQGLR